METNLALSTGDWVVHTQYGIGQIIEIEDKPIHNVDTKCFRVETKDSTYWFPTNDSTNPRIRPVATEEKIQLVIQNLRSKPGNLEIDKLLWKGMIENVQSGNDLLAISLLIRDLSAQQLIRGLNHLERNALNQLTERLLVEWSSIMQEQVADLRKEIQAYLLESQAMLDLPAKNS
jgi:RNA polymerase-interacting CarD/CdnL/TRCF family regulator